MQDVTTIKAMRWTLLVSLWLFMMSPAAFAGVLAPRGGEDTFKTQRKGYTEFRIRNIGPGVPAEVILSWIDYEGLPQTRRVVLIKVGTTEYYENAFGGVTVRVTNQSQSARAEVTASKSKK